MNRPHRNRINNGRVIRLTQRMRANNLQSVNLANQIIYDLAQNQAQIQGGVNQNQMGIRALQIQNANFRRTNQQQTAQIGDLQRDNRAAIRSIANQGTRITDLERENGVQATQITDLRRENGVQATQITDLRRENGVQARRITDLEREILDLEHDNANLQQTVTLQGNQIAGLAAHVADLLARMARLDGQLNPDQTPPSSRSVSPEPIPLPCLHHPTGINIPCDKCFLETQILPQFNMINGIHARLR